MLLSQAGSARHFEVPFARLRGISRFPRGKYFWRRVSRASSRLLYRELRLCTGSVGFGTKSQPARRMLVTTEKRFASTRAAVQTRARTTIDPKNYRAGVTSVPSTLAYSHPGTSIDVDTLAYVLFHFSPPRNSPLIARAARYAAAAISDAYF